MEREVILDKQFNKSLLSVLIYLNEHWSKKVSDEFADLVTIKLRQIQKYPEAGMPSKYKMFEARLWESTIAFITLLIQVQFEFCY